MPKKYISFLGTGIYQECKYRHDDYTSEKVRFIQQANLDKLFSHDKTFGPEDKVVILLTKKSEQLNWVDGGQKDRETDEPLKDKETNEPLKGLKTCIDNLNLPVEVELKKNTPVGNNETEIMEIFSILYNSIDEGDELYLDITHAFRYMPMVLVVLGNYVKLLKKATVASITYGNYEGRVKEDKEDKEDIANVIEFKQLSVIQDWTLAAGQFINCGSADMLVQVADEQLKLKAAPKDEADRAKINILGGIKSLKNVVTNFALCQGEKIKEANELSTAIKALDKARKNISGEIDGPLGPIFKIVCGEVSSLGESKDLRSVIKAAEWCFNRGLYQQAVTLADEAVVSHFTSAGGPDSMPREMVHRCFRIIDKRQESKLQAGNAVEQRFVDFLLSQNIDSNVVSSYTNLVSDLRNYMNHASFSHDFRSNDSFEQGVGKMINVCKTLMSIPVSTPLFINISNHPSDKWSAAQKAAAGVEIVDIPFPNVDPNLGEDELDELADNVMKQVQEVGKNHCPLTAHVMGEMTLTMRLIEKLKNIGVTCVAATTNRNVVDNPDGTRTVTFNFVRFRKY